jgi:hypothetical protein
LTSLEAAESKKERSRYFFILYDDLTQSREEVPPISR